MKVVAGVEALLALGADVAAQVGLVGRLVLREAYVAVDAVGAVFYVEVTDGGVKLADAHQQSFHYFVELRAHLVVPGAVALKPLFIVVGCQFAEELEYFLHECWGLRLTLSHESRVKSRECLTVIVKRLLVIGYRLTVMGYRISLTYNF